MGLPSCSLAHTTATSGVENDRFSVECAEAFLSYSDSTHGGGASEVRFQSPQAIADCIRTFMDGTCGPYDWDDFTSVPLKDPNLEVLRKAASLVRLPADAEGMTELHRLLERANALAENSN